MRKPRPARATAFSPGTSSAARKLEAQLEAFRSHPYLRTCDVLLITEADAGMARSGNRMVAEVLARELGMAQVFAPCYIALGKGLRRGAPCGGR